MTVSEKLDILAGSAKYDASCASSGSERSGAIGACLPSGVCHSWSEDGRCVSLLKILYSNTCSYDCTYCINRVSNDIVRTSFTPEEIVSLTIQFYKRNYIEGLFLSSGIFTDPDIVMQKMVETVKILRTRENFTGYIHLKIIPGSHSKTLAEAGLYADRLSANIELPTSSSLTKLAPQKNGKIILSTMQAVKEKIDEQRNDSFKLVHTSSFAPAGQSTQLIVGASPEKDSTILRLSNNLYKSRGLKRVYYSAFIPLGMNTKILTSNILPDNSLPSARPPLLREHRLYQADWLLRFYKFKVDEILSEDEDLDLELDPKSIWAIRNPSFFPIELSKASYEEILRVPGIGVRNARKIILTRRTARLSYEILRKMKVALRRSRYFITVNGLALDELKEALLMRPLLKSAASDILQKKEKAPPLPLVKQEEFSF